MSTTYGKEIIPGPEGAPNVEVLRWVEPEWVLAAPVADGEAYCAPWSPIPWDEQPDYDVMPSSWRNPEFNTDENAWGPY